MLRYLRYWPLWLAIVLTPSLLAWAQPVQQLTKTVSSSYAVTKNTTVDLSNKYGQILISTWKEDSVVVNVTITAYEKSNEAIGKLMDRVMVDVHYFGGFVTVKTILDKNSSLLKERWNSLMDDSKTLTNKNKISIDYKVTIPEGSTLVLENKFGDVYISGRVSSPNISMAHGDLKAHVFDGLTRMDMSFGKINVKQIDQGFLNLRSADLVLQTTGDLDLTSSSSVVNINEVNNMKLDSRNDKVIINHIQMLRGTSSFTDMKIERLDGFVNYHLKYGEVVISNVQSAFSNLDIQSDSGDINVTFDPGAYVSMNITGSQDNLYLSKNLLQLDRTVIDEKDKIVTLIGSAGLKKDVQSSVNLSSNSGDIFVYLSDQKGVK
ncbi:hypothetical protein SAMN04488028_11438 [Reichenbachiella agariperforans]|uniref:Adhesin n=1 Tax=Reichenbachiella agariperforans TaxID=156994 RepID=A0A1M6WRW8_REIAG|nr:DUF4097 domain-containing protein [Reichenbachiella agariperforans]SHK96458.1 hypothetical protein SAMN04488028_11438 [Reichenbachiella agariperforans]